MEDSSSVNMSISEINENLAKCRDWNIEENGRAIGKDFQFGNFKETISFVNKVAEIAESEGHHPDLRVYDFKNLEIKLSTHSTKGLTQKDFDVAMMIDSL